jgi:protein-disulfide isomerase
MTAKAVAAGLAAVAGLAGEVLIEGKATSRVRVLIFEDLQCGDCAAFRRMMDQTILPKYKDSVAFLHRDFPLPRHTWARKAAIAARFFESKRASLGLDYRRHMLSTFESTTVDTFGQSLYDFCRTHGVDPAEAQDGLLKQEFADRVDRDYREGETRGVTKTPTVIVNGIPFVEKFTFEELSKALDEALAGAR